MKMPDQRLMGVSNSEYMERRTSAYCRTCGASERTPSIIESKELDQGGKANVILQPGVLEMNPTDQQVSPLLMNRPRVDRSMRMPPSSPIRAPNPAPVSNGPCNGRSKAYRKSYSASASDRRRTTFHKAWNKNDLSGEPGPETSVKKATVVTNPLRSGRRAADLPSSVKP